MGDVWKVMVFVVVADVESDGVQGPVVRVRLESFLEHVVLRNEVPGHWVETHGHQSSHQVVEQHLAACIQSKNERRISMRSGY